MAYSAGFTPHPKISYAGAAAMGAASEAEYLEISVTERLDPDRVRAALDAALPPGLDVVEVVEAGSWVPGRPAPGVGVADRAAGRFRRSGGPGGGGVPGGDRGRGRADDEVRRPPVRRPGAGRSTRRRSAARRPSRSPCAILRMVVRHATPAVRPDDVLTALRQVAGLTPPVPPMVTRLAQGPLEQESGTVADPLAADRASDGDAVAA